MTNPKRVWIPTDELPEDKRKTFHTYPYPTKNTKRAEFIERSVVLQAMRKTGESLQRLAVEASKSGSTDIEVPITAILDQLLAD